MAARGTGGRVIEFRRSDDVTPNFHQVLVAYPDRTVAIARARDAPVVAVSEPRVVGFVDGIRDADPLTFVDAPELVRALAMLLPEVRVLTFAEANGPLDPAAWPHVSPDDIKYWRPGTLGAALFHYWD